MDPTTQKVKLIGVVSFGIGKKKNSPPHFTQIDLQFSIFYSVRMRPSWLPRSLRRSFHCPELGQPVRGQLWGQHRWSRNWNPCPNWCPKWMRQVWPLPYLWNSTEFTPLVVKNSSSQQLLCFSLGRLKAFIELTWCPSRALSLASCVASRPEVKQGDW